MTQEQFIDNFFKYAGKVNPIYKQEEEHRNILDDLDTFFTEDPKPHFDTVLLTQDQLRQLDSRQAKVDETSRKNGALYLGQVWLAYGNEDYYLLPNGEIVTRYYSIGD